MVNGNLWVSMCAESSGILKVEMRPRVQSQLTRTPDISPADMNSVESMAAILHKVIDVIYHNSVYYEKVYSMRLMV